MLQHDLTARTTPRRAKTLPGSVREPAERTRLRVGANRDPAEHDADHLADAVMRMPAPAARDDRSMVRRMLRGNRDADVPRQESGACRAGEQVKRNPRQTVSLKNPLASQHVASPAAESGVRSLDPGRPLPVSERAYFEPRFSRDLSGVRIHTGSRAEEASRAIGARAFALGDDIAFAGGEYRPGSTESRRLLAHELTHVVQQRKSGALVQRNGNDAQICSDLRDALADSRRVIATHSSFLAGDITWEDLLSRIRMVGNAAQGVAGAGHDLPEVVQQAIEEVEEFGFEELSQMASMLGALIFGGERQQWARNEIERQKHFNLVLLRLMQEHGCPDVPSDPADFADITRIGTHGTEVIERPGTTSTGRTSPTKTGVVSVDTGSGQVLVLATEVGGSHRLRFENWIDAPFRQLAIDQAEERQGTIPAVPASAVDGLPDRIPEDAARR